MRKLEPYLEPGRVYRTKDFALWAKNPFALATRLVDEGKLVHLGYGLYHHPKQSPLGPLPPMPRELVRAFLDGRPFVFTGSTQWNALGLGTTQVMRVPFVYNTQRSGLFALDGSPFHFRRAAFPEAPSPEWYAVDLLNNLNIVVDADPHRILAAIGRRLGKDLSRPQFVASLTAYGTRATKALVRKSGLLLTEPAEESLVA